MVGTVLKESDDLDILGVTFVSKKTFKNIFTQFPKQLLEDMVSCGSPCENSMVDCYLGGALGVLPCPFWSTVLQYGAWLPKHTLTYWTAYSVVPVF